jgi:hypothetical protein
MIFGKDRHNQRHGIALCPLTRGSRVSDHAQTKSYGGLDEAGFTSRHRHDDAAARSLRRTTWTARPSWIRWSNRRCRSPRAYWAGRPSRPGRRGRSSRSCRRIRSSRSCRRIRSSRRSRRGRSHWPGWPGWSQGGCRSSGTSGCCCRHTRRDRNRDDHLQRKRGSRVAGLRHRRA